MFKIVSITNRKLCADFEARIKELSDNNITFILREKDLSEEEYFSLAERVLKITDNFIIHTFADVARKLNHKKIHLTMQDFLSHDVSDFETVGVSAHTKEDALAAEKGGADYITISPIFYTDCKKDVIPKGVDFLEDISKSVKTKVFALGGISSENISLVKSAGADGACVMSLFMECKSLENELEKMRMCLTLRQADRKSVV